MRRLRGIRVRRVSIKRSTREVVGSALHRQSHRSDRMKGNMDPRREYELLVTRRQLFGGSARGVGLAALASLLAPEAFAGTSGSKDSHAANAGLHGALKALDYAPKAKRVIYLFQSG